MPSADQHRNKAERNRTFLTTIPFDGYPDWAAVVAFYTAVHWVEAVRAATGNGHSQSHEDRLEFVQHHLPDDVHSAYHVLQNVSMLARYQSTSDFYKQFTAEDVGEKLVGVRLALIERAARAAITTPSPSAP